jgi:ferric-dicitrate binding protein FerR (iron transport regulator)
VTGRADERSPEEERREAALSPEERREAALSPEERREAALWASIDGERGAEVASGEGATTESASLERLDAALRGAFAGHPFDTRLAERISAAARERAAHPHEDSGSGRSGRILHAPRPPAKPLHPPARAHAPDDATLDAPRRRIERTIRTYALAAAVLVTGGLAVALLLPGPEAPPPGRAPAVASITARPGASARVIRGADDGYAPEGRTFTLRAGDRIVAERDPVEVALAGGGEMVVKSDTTVELREGGVAIVDGPGFVALAVAPPAAGRRPFRVETPEGVAVEARGTRFGVHFDGERVTTLVADGKVTVSGAFAPAPVEVGPGRRLTVAVFTQRAESGRADLASDLAWTGWRGLEPAKPVVVPVPTNGAAAGAPVAPGAPPAAGRPAPAGGSGAFLPIGPPEKGGEAPRREVPRGDLPIGGTSGEGE